MANIRDIRTFEITSPFTGYASVPVLTLENCGDYDIGKTFDCGQCFRFDPVPQHFYGTVIPTFVCGDSQPTAFCGTAYGKFVTFVQDSEKGVMHIVCSDEADYRNIWEKFLALDESYEEINADILSGMPNEKYRETMARAIECGNGIRILRQEPWEALASFIISQNNNIPRIKKIVNALCVKYGEPTIFGKSRTFPDAKTIHDGGIEALDELKMGFRNKYMMDACEKVMSGEIDFSKLGNDISYADALEKITSIKGVGPKVGSCTLLFGLHHLDAFPVDVWIKKSLAVRFPEGIEISAFGRYAGVAQQYLFYYERYIQENVQ